MAHCVQSTLQQLQKELEDLKAQHGRTATELAELQASNSALQANKDGLDGKVLALEQQLAKVGSNIPFVSCCRQSARGCAHV